MRYYAAIDLKSFYASVECVERGLDPMSTNLVVADESRTEKTICLAVSPTLKALGISGRARLFEVVQRVGEINRARKKQGQEEVTYITAVPRMALYMEYSARIYNIYLQYIAPEDIHVYSVDEVFIDLTPYLNTYHTTPLMLTKKLIREVYTATGITATGGIGTNLYLCKVAMDIMAKHEEADEDGVRVAFLDEDLYRRKLWNHRPITDFWRVGDGYARRLEGLGLYTMGDIARCSLGKDSEHYNEELLYKTFGINAELLIDHAWGWEPCTMEAVKAYKPAVHSLESGQVLKEPYTSEKAKIVIKEMADMLSLDLVEKQVVCSGIGIYVAYDNSNLQDPEIRKAYRGPIKKDYYGRMAPKSVHGSVRFERPTASSRQIMQAVSDLYDKLVDPILLVRRLSIGAASIMTEAEAKQQYAAQQLDLFMEDPETTEEIREADEAKEKKLQQALLSIKDRYGRNAVLRGMNYEEGATARERNGQIGGHRA